MRLRYSSLRGCAQRAFLRVLSNGGHEGHVFEHTIPHIAIGAFGGFILHKFGIIRE